MNNECFESGSDRTHQFWLEKYNLTHFAETTVLDLGCRTGALCKYAKSKGAKKCVAVDIVKPNEIWPVDIDFLSLDLNSSEWTQHLPETKFDFIFAFDILEHLDAPYLFLLNCSKVLSQSGYLVVSTPNISSWERLISPRGWSGATDPQHKTLFAPYSLEFLLQKVGLYSVILKAPIRKLGPLSDIFNLGGQIFSVSKLNQG
jgi:2-polyprenyl-3-methyl-5-hydroxy-6-metoxy-1,4-benzoquinol methylase